MKIRTCNKCGFILGTRPGLMEKDGVCQACINSENKKNIDFKERQDWLTHYIKQNKTHPKYDCVIGVSGGKDSHMIVATLMEKHNVSNPLLVTVCDEFTMTEAGKHNRDNISRHFSVDHLIFRYSPEDFKKNTLHDFETALHPLKWIEEKLYLTPFEVAKNFGIKLVFMGEDPAYEYGSSAELKKFDKLTNDQVKVLYFGAFYPYSNIASYNVAKKHGFLDLNDCFEWYRSGSCDMYAQIDSIGYIVHHWCKFPKFGFQRVSDMACRFVREGTLTREQACELIKDRDYQLDGKAKADFCRLLSISPDFMDSVVEKHANTALVHKDVNGFYRRNDF